MKTLIYDKKQFEQMLKDNNYFLSESYGKDFLAPRDIDFINKQFPELPKEELLVSRNDSLAYRLSGDLGYGFPFGLQDEYLFSNDWDFSKTEYWQQATPEQEKRFVEMLKKECENKGLFEDTKIEFHADGSGSFLNTNHFSSTALPMVVYNKNGQIFYKGKFAKPLKESTLDKVTDAVKDIADFTIEETITGLIILTPIKQWKTKK